MAHPLCGTGAPVEDGTNLDTEVHIVSPPPQAILVQVISLTKHTVFNTKQRRPSASVSASATVCVLSCMLANRTGTLLRMLGFWSRHQWGRGWPAAKPIPSLIQLHSLARYSLLRLHQPRPLRACLLLLILGGQDTLCYTLHYCICSWWPPLYSDPPITALHVPLRP